MALEGHSRFCKGKGQKAENAFYGHLWRFWRHLRKKGRDPLGFSPRQSFSVAGVAVEVWATRSVVQAPVGNHLGVVHQGRQIHGYRRQWSPIALIPTPSLPLPLPGGGNTTG